MTDMTTSNAGDPLPFEEARVRDVMNDGVVSCPSDMPLRAVAAIMVRERIHSVVVFDGGPERAWGIISDLDVVSAANSDLDREQASAVAGTPVVTVGPNERLARVVQLMTEYQTTHLIVVEPESDRPVGVVSTLDIARTLAEA
jgi:CBS domain-containing protein